VRTELYRGAVSTDITKVLDEVVDLRIVSEGKLILLK